MSKVNSALERAIIDKAMKDPIFMANLLRDPIGCLKALAREEAHPVPAQALPRSPRTGRRAPLKAIRLFIYSR